ncbi:MAG: class I SAM-dependent RNA methyltransferase, partial [Alphaproteobacteria bacterium]
MTTRLELDITGLGAHGDGIAALNGRPVFVPCTLPGERVGVRLERPPKGRARGKTGGPLRARVSEILEPSPDRVAPSCSHFGACGGCTLQHFAPEPAARWKHALVVEALSRRGLPTDNVRPLTTIAPGKRRRADLTAIRRQDDVLLGFNARQSHRVVDVTACPVLVPEITRLLPALRALLADLLGVAKRAEIVVNASETGLDLLLVSDAGIDAAGYQAIAGFAETHDLARISRQHAKSGPPETIAQRRAPMASFGGIPVALPPGAFLQASAEGEAALLAC